MHAEPKRPLGRAESTDVFTARPSWSTVPAPVRAHLSELVGSPTVSWLDLHGGMSPGPAARLTLADGRQVFVKGGSALVGPRSHQLHVLEADVLDRLPPTVPAARLLAVARTSEWIVLATTWIDGPTASAPWTESAVRAVAEACERVAAHPALVSTPRIADRYNGMDGWALLAASHSTGDHLDAWESRHVEQFADVTADWRDWIDGESLVHHDVRGDNAVIDRRTGRATLVDWAFCGHGPPWLDKASLAADIVAAGHVGGPGHATQAAMRLLATEPSEASRFVVAVAGMWRFNATLAPHPGMPTHRRWQLDRAGALRPLLDAIRTTTNALRLR